ncbi:unnamed protein product [Lampetra planeri]
MKAAAASRRDASRCFPLGNFPPLVLEIQSGVEPRRRGAAHARIRGGVGGSSGISQRVTRARVRVIVYPAARGSARPETPATASGDGEELRQYRVASQHQQTPGDPTPQPRRGSKSQPGPHHSTAPARPAAGCDSHATEPPG